MTSHYTHRILDEAGVDAVLGAAEKHALKNAHRVVIAVVERSGELMGLRRTPGAQVASSRVAVDKARTAATFIRPSRELEQQVSSGRLGALALHGARALTGGIPLKVGDEVVGAIGTSGETPDEDEAVLLAGAAAEFSTVTVPALSAADARRAAEAVASECARRGVSPVCAVVDAGGELICIWRPDKAQVASGPAAGRIPIVHDGHVIGAVGCAPPAGPMDDPWTWQLLCARRATPSHSGRRNLRRPSRSPATSRSPTP
jgi:glc operon protein GlcG